MSAVEFTHDRRQAIIPVAVLPPASQGGSQLIERLRGLIDTGASISSVPQEVAARLRLPYRGKDVITTARGDVMARYYEFRIGLYPRPDDVLPIVGERILLGIAGTAGHDFDVLIGMDILGRGDLTIRRDGTGTFTFDET